MDRPTVTSAGSSSVTYYYLTNLQGDITGILDASGTSVAAYTYNAWGKLLSSSGDLASINPLRYRGYYYDAELEMYYLKSRYYDPEICRFINADGYASTGQGFVGTNMFAYCKNNPICFVDYSGYAAGLIGSIAISAVIGGLWGGVTAALSGGNVVEGVLFGAVSAVIGVVASPLVAATINAVAAFGKSIIDQAVENKRNQTSKEIDYVSATVSAGYAFAGTFLGGKLAGGAAPKGSYSVPGNAVANWFVGLATGMLDLISQKMIVMEK